MLLDLFVCDKCGFVDSCAFAYSRHNFHMGPPESWLCCTCQGKLWHGWFIRRAPKAGERLVNRPAPGIVPDFG